ncbi:MAG: ABC transporter ATP-binding protein [Clostridia bacterium]|nr:ABC transporter ATP-binding protein [Clostridia bacterium]
MFLSLCAAAVSWVSVRFALVSKDLLDSAIISEKRIFFKDNLIKLAFLVAAQLFLHILYTLVSLKTEGMLRNKLQSVLFNKLLYKKWQSVSEYHSGELLNRLNGDVNIVSSHIISMVPNVMALVSKIALAFGALYMLDKDFAFIFLIVGPVVMIIARLYSSRIKPLSKKCLESQGSLHSFLLESIRNIIVIKSFGKAEEITSEASKLQKKNLSLIMKRGYLNVFANILFYISLTTGYYFAVAWCAWKIANALMTVGTFTAIIQLVGQVQTPFKDLASVIPQFYTLTVSAERITELENLPNEELRYKNIDAASLYNEMKNISINDISFSYNEEVIFENANVTIPKGSLVAISGISGIGKSTLIKLIMGIITPNDGEIRVNTSNNSYIADASLRKLFAYVPQGNMILSGSIKDNITFMSDNIDEEKVIEAAKTACIWDVIESLPNGLDTVLGEGGTGLSEGQIQRLAVARAVYSDAPILLLDEATSALDEATEEKMLDNIMNNEEKTCIIISHKRCAIDKCNMRLDIENMMIKSINK